MSAPEDQKQEEGNDSSRQHWHQLHDLVGPRRRPGQDQAADGRPAVHDRGWHRPRATVRSQLQPRSRGLQPAPVQPAGPLPAGPGAPGSGWGAHRVTAHAWPTFGLWIA